MEIKIKIDLDDVEAIKDLVLSGHLEMMQYFSENDTEKIDKFCLIKEYLDGGLRTPPMNSRPSGRVRFISYRDYKKFWIKDTKNEWYDKTCNRRKDGRIEMYRLEELDDIINGENDIIIKHFIEQIWLDTVMDGDIPWLILDAIKLESLTSSMVMEELMSTIIRLFEEGLDRDLETDIIQEISVPISDDETSGGLFG